VTAESVMGLENRRIALSSTIRKAVRPAQSDLPARFMTAAATKPAIAKTNSGVCSHSRPMALTIKTAPTASGIETRDLQSSGVAVAARVAG
jgi:hypothetical protein